MASEFFNDGYRDRIDGHEPSPGGRGAQCDEYMDGYNAAHNLCRAAPDMLEACVQAESLLAYIQAAHEPPSHDRIARVVRVLNTAIARAKGV